MIFYFVSEQFRRDKSFDKTELIWFEFWCVEWLELDLIEEI